MKLSKQGFRLSSHDWQKREFDPCSADDLTVYRKFLLDDRWENGCPFVIEWPFLNVLDMIEHKIIYQHIDSLIKTSKKAKA